MSRSFKKVPIHKDNGKYSKDSKRRANRKIRRTGIVASGGSYKKHYPQYDIHDFCSYWSKEDALKAWNNPNGRMYHYLGTEQAFLQWWKKSMIRK